MFLICFLLEAVLISKKYFSYRSRMFRHFYIQEYLFLSFLWLCSPLHAREKEINILSLLYKNFGDINSNSFLDCAKIVKNPIRCTALRARVVIKVVFVCVQKSFICVKTSLQGVVARVRRKVLVWCRQGVCLRLLPLVPRPTFRLRCNGVSQ